MAAHIALHEIGVSFDGRPIALGEGGTRTPEFLAINPEGKVPTLVIDGRVLTQVAGVLYYLARRYPDAGLWPFEDVEAEAQAVSWMSFIASAIHPARRDGEEHARQIWGIAERKFGNGEWALGRYSVVDIHLFRLYWRFGHALCPGAEAWPRLEAHYARMMARPAVKKTIEVESGIGYALPR